MPHKKKPNRAVAPFIKSLERKFGLWPTYASGEFTRVLSVPCRSCHVVGREIGEDGSNRKRKRTECCKYFEVFCTDFYKKHLTAQQPRKWSSYQGLTDARDQDPFFNAVKITFTSIIQTHVELGNQLVKFIIDKVIVEVIIGSIIFDSDDLLGIATAQRALSIFKLLEPDCRNEDESGRDQYVGYDQDVLKVLFVRVVQFSGWLATTCSTSKTNLEYLFVVVALKL